MELRSKVVIGIVRTTNHNCQATFRSAPNPINYWSKRTPWIWPLTHGRWLNLHNNSIKPNYIHDHRTIAEKRHCANKCAITSAINATSIKIPLYRRINPFSILRNVLPPFCTGRLRNFFKHKQMATLETLNFDNLLLRSLPIDQIEDDSPRQVTGACFSRVKPTPVQNPQTVLSSVPALSLLDLPESEINRSEFAEYFSGSKLLPNSETAAHCYCGHQFGSFAGQLGDGAAIYLGEVVNKAGERWEIQLKGAGRTPYSRTADGRKVLRSSIREFLCSEAMYHLGIPTTRAGSCITSDSTVIRDIFYSGNPIEEKCTIVLRIAPSFIRFGSFQICKPPDRDTGREGPSVGRLDVLEELSDYVIKNLYPQIHEQYGADKKEACKEMFREVVLRTARLVAQWQCVGWCHGVLNTDNMSILGLTIDYGPYGFMDSYHPGYVCNNSDNGGRYAYDKQPEMCKWNCEKLMLALGQMLYMDTMELYPILELYDAEYEKSYIEIMRKKFGLFKAEDSDIELVKSFMTTLAETGADFTNSFRCLSLLDLPGMSGHDSSKTALLEQLLKQCCTLEELIGTNRPKMDRRQLQMFMMLLEMNPQLASQMGTERKALHDEMKRMETVKKLKERTEEEKSASDRATWTRWLDLYTTRLSQDVETNEELEQVNRRRREVMNSTNPRFILRNYIAQVAIEAAEQGDYSEVRQVLRLLQDPYSDSTDISPLTARSTTLREASDSAAEGSSADVSRPSDTVTAYDERPPVWAGDIRVT